MSCSRGATLVALARLLLSCRDGHGKGKVELLLLATRRLLPPPLRLCHV